MEARIRLIRLRFHVYYTILFIAFGALTPLLPLFYQSHQLTGYQIGILMGIGPILSVIFQPVWGLICDLFDGQKKVLFITLICSGSTSLLFLFANTYFGFLIMAILLGIFQCALIPVSDSLTLHHVYKSGGEYGRIRLWGSIGFAFAAWFSGFVGQYVSLASIFWFYAIALVVAAVLTHSLPNEGTQVSANLFRGIGQLMKIKRFLLFLVGTFLVYGTMSANNFFFGILYKHAGGSLTGVGVAFLLGAGSEAPIMQLTGKWMRNYSIAFLLLISAVVSSFRWFLFAAAMPSWMLLVIFFLQGLSIGLFLPVAAIFIRNIAPVDMQATAQGIYAAIGNGLGSMACSFIGGVILDHADILHVYQFLGYLSVLGAICFLILWVGIRKQV